MTKSVESKILDLIAADRVYIPISSMDGKLKRRRANLARSIDLKTASYSGERVYARIETDDTMKARGMKEAIAVFEQSYPRYGRILKGMIEEKRADREVTLYFGMNAGTRLTADDYLGVMRDLGFTDSTAERLYPELMQISRNLSKKREEERGILIG